MRIGVSKLLIDVNCEHVSIVIKDSKHRKQLSSKCIHKRNCFFGFAFFILFWCSGRAAGAQEHL